MSNFSLNGADYSANPVTIPGSLSLLATIPANRSRIGYFIQNQDGGTAKVYIVFDDGTSGATTIILAPGASSGSQGGSLAADGIPHNGRIRIYGDTSGTRMAARVW